MPGVIQAVQADSFTVLRLLRKSVAKGIIPTVKPVSLIKYLVTLVTPPNGVCLDPFMGSGTTAIACINTNRNFIGFEIDKHYCDIANERIRKALAEKVVSK